MPRDIKIIRLECGKANAIDEHLLDTMRSELDRASAEKARAVVLTGYDRFFSSGLNLKSLPDTREGMLVFAEKFDRELAYLWNYPLPVVAAVNGHAVAGGCVLACACDVRIGAEGKFRIGLSELDVGVPFPAVALTVVRQAVAASWIAEVVLGARALTPSEAHQAGILHSTAAPDQLLQEAVARAEHLGAKPQPAFGLTKEALHIDLLARVEPQRAEARERFVDCWFSDEVRKTRESML